LEYDESAWSGDRVVASLLGLVKSTPRVSGSAGLPAGNANLMLNIPIIQWLSYEIGLFGAAPVRGLQVSSQYYYVGLAILVLLMLLALVKAYREWQDFHDVDEPASPADLLESFEQAHAAGELDDEEFERVRQRLSGMGKDKDAPSANPAPDERSPDGS
jgi:uncharacterized membrane protein